MKKLSAAIVLPGQVAVNQILSRRRGLCEPPSAVDTHRANCNNYPLRREYPIGSQVMTRFVRFVLFLLAGTFASTPLFAQTDNPPDWENPRVFGINKELPHATLVPFPN